MPSPRGAIHAAGCSSRWLSGATAGTMRRAARSNSFEEVGGRQNSLLVVIDAFPAQHASFLLPLGSESLKDTTLIGTSARRVCFANGTCSNGG